VELILTRAIDSLAANGVTPDRDMWLKQAEEVRDDADSLDSGSDHRKIHRKSIENP